MAVQKLSKQASCLCTALHKYALPPPASAVQSPPFSLKLCYCAESLTYSTLCYLNLGLTEHLPIEPCPQPAVLPATVVLNCKRRSLNTLYSWPEISLAIPLLASHSPLHRDLPAYFQPPPPIPWPLPSPGWVFSSRSQTNLKSFLVSGCIWNAQCSDGFKCIEINGFSSSLAWSMIVSSTRFAEVQLLVWELTWITKDFAAAALWNAIKKQFCLL